MIRKQLGPPKGAGAAADAATAAIGVSEADRIAQLSSRYSQEQAAQPVWPGTAAAAAPATPAVPEAKPKKARRARTEPAGMTRRTYYLAEASADALDAAVDTVVAASRGRVEKHVALAALIAAAVEQTDAISTAVREAILRDLTGDA